ncbi:MAG TPA: OmpW family outer membrane protein [Ramlibacter sp.]|jgi:outer membrane protein|nr:OmpW family outer membrane protein [Ramlibacter sp.]
MKTKLHCTIAALALAAGAAQAQQAGNWMGRVGVTRISPQVSSGNLTAPSLPGTQADIRSDTEPSGGITYMVTNNWSVDLPIALPYEHDIVGAGAIAGSGKIGEVKALPITLLGQYRFGAPNAKFRPYLGAGPTYVKFYHERSTGVLSALTAGSPTTLSVGSKLALTVQAGATMALNERWFVDAMVAKTFLKTRTTLSTGQTLDIRSDPLTLALSVGYRF